MKTQGLIQYFRKEESKEWFVKKTKGKEYMLQNKG